jgi:PTH1 family peptidyl-tRNA hydrolase
MKLIIGLGNPGKEYELSRHNVGFMIVDEFRIKLEERQESVEYQAQVSKGKFADQEIVVARPTTYMNNSGRSVAGVVRVYQPAMEDLLVVHDDLDLPLFTLRFKQGGGSAGHNGVRSVMEALGTDEFCRLRFGIGRPPGRMDPAAYVLEPFAKKEMEELGFYLGRAADALATYVELGIEAAMNRYNMTIS